MEINFGLLVVAALVGLIVNAIWGLNPVAIMGSFALLVLLLPMLQLAFVHDPQTAQAISDGMIERLINALPTLVVGELAGSVAMTIFKSFKGVF